VGNFILKECLVNYLGNKTRVLVTHKFESLKFADYIYIFKKGKVVEEGTLESLKGSQIFNEIEEKYKTMAKSEESKEDDQEKFSSKEEEPKLENPISDMPNEETAPQEEISSENNPTKEEIEKITEEEDKKLSEKLMLDEDREIGEVKWSVWKSYFIYYGGWFYFFLVFLGKDYFLLCAYLKSYVHFHQFANSFKLLAILLE